MKKTILAILSFISITQASYADAYYTENNFDSSSGTINLEDVSSTFSNDAFAISFNLDRCLAEIYSSNDFCTLILGPDSFRVDIVSLGSAMTMSAGGTVVYTWEVPQTSGPFVLQFEGRVCTLLYSNDGSLATIMTAESNKDIPDVLDMATLTFTNVTASNVTTWTGVVSAADLENPIPAPTPNVPEPATSTLSLLALAGLAARRRRK